MDKNWKMRYPRLPFFTKKTCWEPSQVSTEVLDKVVDCFTLFQLHLKCDHGGQIPFSKLLAMLHQVSFIQKPDGYPSLFAQIVGDFKLA